MQYRRVSLSQTLFIHAQGKELERQNRKVYKFGFGQSPFAPPQYVLEALRDNIHHKEYSLVQGDETLRYYAARFHAQVHGIPATPEHTLIGPGSKMLLYTILMAYPPSDVLISAPSWVSYGPQAKMAGHHVIRIPTGFGLRWRITPRQLLRAMSKKIHPHSILIINYPGNPDGLSYSEKELSELAEIARRHRMLVISDEIYALLTFEGVHHSFARFYPERTIVTTGLSKWCGAGGWRLGVAFLYPSISRKFKDSILGVASETYSCAPVPVQHAARTAYRDIHAALDYAERQRNILRQVAQYCYEALLRAGVQVHRPQGAFYMFPDFSPFREKLHRRGIYNARQLCQTLLTDTGVMLLPASAFGMHNLLLAARLSYVDFDDPLTKEDFDIRRDCPRIVEGMQLLTDWLRKL